MNVLKTFPLLSRFGLLVVLPVIGIFLYLYGEFTQSPIERSATVESRYINANVAIYFDQNKVPILRADSDQDAYYALGYLHAAERMWQLEMQRRFAQGRLSEVYGKSTINTDIYIRTLGLYKNTQTSFANMSEPAQQALVAYTKGINFWLAQQTSLPAVFEAFGLKPEPWQVADTLAWLKVFALNLSGNMNDEIYRLNGLQVASQKQLKVFYPYADISDISIADKLVNQDKRETTREIGYADFHTAAADLRSTWLLAEPLSGSNAWVVSAQLSESGQTMLANDPHLPTQTPSQWYPITIKTPQLHLSGMSLVGVPAVVLGRNQHIAWGATSLIADQQDLYAIDTLPHDKGYYQTASGPRAFKFRTEVFNVRADFPSVISNEIKPIEVTVRETHVGPVISDALVSTTGDFALQWVALDPNDTSFEAFFQLQYAQNHQEFQQASAKLMSPGLHLLYADTAGNIASQVAGAFPIRAKGQGTLPVAMESVEQENWRGYVDFTRLPSQFNPSAGYIASANNQILSEDVQALIISSEWAPSTRFRRIKQMLEQQIQSNVPFNTKFMQKMQMDNMDIDAHALINRLFTAQVIESILQDTRFSDTSSANKALKALTQWQGHFSLESVGASIYTYWYINFQQLLFNDTLNPTPLTSNRGLLAANLIGRSSEESILSELKLQDGQWCQLVDCQSIVVDAFFNALDTLEKVAGNDDVDDWQWHEFHYVRYGYRPLSEINTLGNLFSRDVSAAGSANTINAANKVYQAEGDFRVTFGTAFRNVFDMAMDQGYFAIPSAPSGYPGDAIDPHFIDSFTQGQLFSYPTLQVAQNAKEQINIIAIGGAQ